MWPYVKCYPAFTHKNRRATKTTTTTLKTNQIPYRFFKIWKTIFCGCDNVISILPSIYKVVQIWPGLIVCKQVTVCPGHIWTTLYNLYHTVYSVRKEQCSNVKCIYNSFCQFSSNFARFFTSVSNFTCL